MKTFFHCIFAVIVMAICTATNLFAQSNETPGGGKPINPGGTFEMSVSGYGCIGGNGFFFDCLLTGYDVVGDTWTWDCVVLDAGSCSGGGIWIWGPKISVTTGNGTVKTIPINAIPIGIINKMDQMHFSEGVTVELQQAIKIAVRSSLLQ